MFKANALSGILNAQKPAPKVTAKPRKAKQSQSNTKKKTQ